MRTTEMALVFGAGTNEGEKNPLILQRESPKKQMVQAVKRLAIYENQMKKEGK